MLTNETYFYAKGYFMLEKSEFDHNSNTLKILLSALHIIHVYFYVRLGFEYKIYIFRSNYSNTQLHRILIIHCISRNPKMIKSHVYSHYENT